MIRFLSRFFVLLFLRFGLERSLFDEIFELSLDLLVISFVYSFGRFLFSARLVK